MHLLDKRTSAIDNTVKYVLDDAGNPIELHYTLIAGVNDTDDDVRSLAVLLRGSSITIKFLSFEPKADGLQPTSLERVSAIREYLEHYGDVRTEYDSPIRLLASNEETI